MPKHLHHRRDFIGTLATAIGAASLPAWAQDEAGSPVKPGGIPTIWIGGVTPEGGVVKTKLLPGTPAKLLVLAPGASPLVFAPEKSTNPGSPVTTFRPHGLTPDTSYTCTLEVLGKPATYPPAVLRTFPPAGKAASFAFAFASCARTGSEHPVFSTIEQRRPAFFLHLGDLHYLNITRNEPRHYRAAWDTVLSSSTQGPLYRNVPFVHIWDDHDFGPNGSDGRAPGSPAARATYREYAPHYPLTAGDGDAAIHHAFSLGRVRFILTDLRSERSRESLPEGPQKTTMGAAQKAWFFRELLESSRTHALVFWASSVPWIGANSTSDSWANYATERAEIANFIAANRIHNLCILCGDAHMLAADDGTHSDYSTAGGLHIPVLHGSALDQAGSYKGGPYSHGHYLPQGDEGCFGWVEVKDDGTSVTVEFSGRNHDDIAKVELGFRA